MRFIDGAINSRTSRLRPGRGCWPSACSTPSRIKILELTHKARRVGEVEGSIDARVRFSRRLQVGNLGKCYRHLRSLNPDILLPEATFTTL